MRRRVIFTMFFSLITVLGIAKDFRYSVIGIPKTLSKDANAVIRESRFHMTIKNEKSACYQVHRVVTVYNHKGLSKANLVLLYDPDRKIKKIKGTLYNSFGMPVRKIKKDDIQDVSAFDGYSFHRDDRLKIIQLTPSVYPFTVEYDYEIDCNGFLGLEGWSPISFNVAVQKSEYIATVAKDYAFRYREMNFDKKGVKKDLGDEWEYTWTVENKKAIKKEPYSPYIHEYLPHLEVAPSRFYFDHVRGDMSSWETYGNWMQSLLKERDVLPEKALLEVRKLVAPLTSKKEKVEALYKYMQARTRYVSIQLGIGGFQPFPASMVHEKGYGDCKALSNYMRALLKAVGIHSLYVEIGAGSNPGIIYPDFPTASQSNHIIVAVPNEKDTIWLECTSQILPCGVLGASCCGKRVLAIDEDKVEVITTPISKTEDNRLEQEADIVIDEKGNAQVAVASRFQGTQFTNNLFLIREPLKKQKEQKYSELELPGAKIEKLGYFLDEDKCILNEELELHVENYASSTRNRMFVPINVLNRGYRPPKNVANRKTDVFRRQGYTDCDTIVFQLPDSYKVEALPSGVELETPFGAFSMKVEEKDGQVFYYRRMQVKDGKFPADSYGDLISFFSKISSSDGNRFVLVKKE